ncbi:conserved hypothetical protein [Exiguobacterium sibiricum 255-15]|uniref:Sporulation protein YpjB n=1 Tax=Exiguobacterium sibiricum (strain DSM 17290 / CCUG 55495 / CIP 109462 / JCM 13490 / 255-15) TaxID=262543 RepID=B1YF56_EXIS2|nr:hypothetical protein [Exiguobacterium sibiricum]ACB62280.1 conserved hypothetical protein [Exiguobacterium sibiricum 255-15]
MRKPLVLTIIAFLFLLTAPLSASAYSYGDPGKEAFAEAYKQFEEQLDQKDYKLARETIDAYDKEFTLYFPEAKEKIDAALADQDTDAAKQAYRVALRQNIERRLHFAQEQFDDFGQAKLLLAKARGTYDVLAPYVKESEDAKTSDSLYTAFDESLAALGNPGLFGVGKKASDREAFDQNIKQIEDTITPLFVLPGEEKTGVFDEEDSIFGQSFGTDDIWKTVAISLVIILIVIVIIGQRKKRRAQ